MCEFFLLELSLHTTTRHTRPQRIGEKRSRQICSRCFTFRALRLTEYSCINLIPLS